MPFFCGVIDDRADMKCPPRRLHEQDTMLLAYCVEEWLFQVVVLIYAESEASSL